MNETMPSRYCLDSGDPITKLRAHVIEALESLPHYFVSPINIEGLVATDLFSMNTLLGGAIEEQTVRILNTLRSVWDSENQYQDYTFIRFPESFPDVRLVRGSFDTSPILGLELKGWYLLSKEREPSFRYRASVEAVTVHDLIVCVPWALSNVLSGTPMLFRPFVEQAKYASDMRTFYWEHRKGGNASRITEIRHPDTQPYPKPGTRYADAPVYDGGGNFGRIARIPGLMTAWIQDSLDTKLAGIEAKYWIRFFSAFGETSTSGEVERHLARLEKLALGLREDEDDGVHAQLLYHLEGILSLVDEL